MTACNYLCVVERDEALEEATRRLYSTPPEQFAAKRTELARAAKRSGLPQTAQAVTRLRKPTVAAWVVNAYAAANPILIDQLTGVGDQLREAQDSLQVDQLRQLSAERRKLVRGLTQEALRLADRHDAPTSLHEEVAATFDAAVADPSVAASLGSLQHAEHFSGFGFGAGAPRLTVVRGKGGAKISGGPEGKSGRATPGRLTVPARSTAEQRRLVKAVDAARAAMASTRTNLDGARAGERSARQHLHDVEEQLEELQRRVVDAHADLEQARAAVTAAEVTRTAAAAELEHAERRLHR